MPLYRVKYQLTEIRTGDVDIQATSPAKATRILEDNETPEVATDRLIDCLEMKEFRAEAIEIALKAERARHASVSVQKRVDVRAPVQEFAVVLDGGDHARPDVVTT